MSEMGTAEIELGRSRQHQRRHLELVQLSSSRTTAFGLVQLSSFTTPAFELIQMSSFSTPTIELIQKPSFRTTAIGRIILLKARAFLHSPPSACLLPLCSGCAVRSVCSYPLRKFGKLLTSIYFFVTHSIFFSLKCNLNIS